MQGPWADSICGTRAGWVRALRRWPEYRKLDWGADTHAGHRGSFAIGQFLDVPTYAVSWMLLGGFDPLTIFWLYGVFEVPPDRVLAA